MTDDAPVEVVVAWVELAKDAVVADVTVSAHGAWALVLIEGNEPDELELDGTLSVGAGGGVGIDELLEDADDALNGDGGAAAVVGAMAPGGAVCAPAFVVAVKSTIPATAPRRNHRSGVVIVERLRIIAGDP